MRLGQQKSDMLTTAAFLLFYRYKSKRTAEAPQSDMVDAAKPFPGR
jgi:hypothetical protein